MRMRSYDTGIEGKSSKKENKGEIVAQFLKQCVLGHQ